MAFAASSSRSFTVEDITRIANSLVSIEESIREGTYPLAVFTAPPFSWTASINVILGMLFLPAGLLEVVAAAGPSS